MNELVYCHWYTHYAVYRDGKLVYYGELEREGGLLRALGFTGHHLKEIPTHDIPPEFDRGERGWWKPPQDLATLEDQQARYQKRRHAERLASAREEVARLEKEGTT